MGLELWAWVIPGMNEFGLFTNRLFALLAGCRFPNNPAVGVWLKLLVGMKSEFELFWNILLVLLKLLFIKLPLRF